MWGTYYGGTSYDAGYGLAIDQSGNIYLTGYTSSATGIASGGFQNNFAGGNDAFLVKFSNNGNRIWATYFGGSGGEGNYSYCTVDNMGNVYLSGATSSTSGIASGGHQNVIGGNPSDVYADAFLVKFNSSGSRLWATYYGGSKSDYATCCTTDNLGNVYLSGGTSSINNIASGGFQNSFIGGGIFNEDAFLAKFKSDGTRMWGSYFGGNGGDQTNGLCNDTNNNVYMAGKTYSASNISSGGFQNVYGGYSTSSYERGGDAFFTKIDGSKTFKTLCPNASDSITSNFTGPSYQWQIDTGSGFVNITDTVFYSGITNKTLRFVNLPSSFYSYQYRAFVNGIYTEPFQLKFATRWIGTTNTAWENPANWSCGILPDGNTDVIINTDPVTLNSNGICRTLTVRPGVSFTVAAGNTLTITH